LEQYDSSCSEQSSSDYKFEEEKSISDLDNEEGNGIRLDFFGN